MSKIIRRHHAARTVFPYQAVKKLASYTPITVLPANESPSCTLKIQILYLSLKGMPFDNLVSLILLLQETEEESS
ncbi:hypothetical protein SAMN05216404_108158 [Nitrosospira multiformis]|uniref:Uncharacterized protein n=1 Tax=Nitrosospira multiformis TaxID=1231 RepID=A0A1H8KIS9_9PROT|nr:hypothetical protein SAMN05216404_108158 [Nitrosospira multiformis]